MSSKWVGHRGERTEFPPFAVRGNVTNHYFFCPVGVVRFSLAYRWRTKAFKAYPQKRHLHHIRNTLPYFNRGYSGRGIHGFPKRNDRW